MWNYLNLQKFSLWSSCLKERVENSAECMILIFMEESQTFSRFKKNRNTSPMKINTKPSKISQKMYKQKSKIKSHRVDTDFLVLLNFPPELIEKKCLSWAELQSTRN